MKVSKLSLLFLSVSSLAACGSDPVTPPPPASDVPAAETAADASVPMDVAPNADAAQDDGVMHLDIPRDNGTCVVADDAGTQPDGAGLPNLQPRVALSSVQYQTRTFTEASGEVIEGCTLPGTRRLLRFTLQTPNVGAGDVYFGSPIENNRPRDMFEWSPVHMHYHLLGYADYRLFDADNHEVARGHKQSFCFEDSRPLTTAAQTAVPAAQRYNCGNMGIHAGWLDEYGRHLDCQYIDITNLPAGHYRIQSSINGLHTIPESNYCDNVTNLELDIPEGDPIPATGVDVTQACAADAVGTERDCGWSLSNSEGCIPGQRVTVGCNPRCAEGLGSFEADPVIRVCPGNFPCTHEHAVMDGENDDSCGTTGSQVSFICPDGGRYSVLTGGHRSGTPAICQYETYLEPLPPEGG